MELTKKIRLRNLMLATAWAVLSACGAASGGDSDSSAETTTDESFPTELALASPLSTSGSDSTTSLIRMASTSSGASTTSMASGVAAVSSILSGTTVTSCSFDPALFLTLANDAACYGPRLDYQAHPDASGTEPDSGELPPHDVGLWLEEEGTSGEACAAAQLNARMQASSDKSQGALEAVASLLCVANVNGYTKPTNSTVTITTEMAAMASASGIPVSFTSATISHSDASGSDQITYAVDFTYTPGASSYDVQVDMVHQPDAAGGEYVGRLSYQFNDSFADGNCPTSAVTQAGSLLYNRVDTDLNIESRTAVFCGHNATNAFDSGVVDRTAQYDGSSGWTDNFDIFTADFELDTLAGDYTYAWQAGYRDSHTRVFNLTLNTASEGTAFFGYGEEIATTDGSISGFICNWAGPGSTKLEHDKVQSQGISFDTTAGVYVADVSAITYAPTNSCDHDGSGTFLYDTDADGLLTDETTAVVNDTLEILDDTDANGEFDVIEAAGFTLPTAPANI